MATSKRRDPKPPAGLAAFVAKAREPYAVTTDRVLEELKRQWRVAFTHNSKPPTLATLATVLCVDKSTVSLRLLALVREDKVIRHGNTTRVLWIPNDKEFTEWEAGPCS